MRLFLKILLTALTTLGVAFVALVVMLFIPVTRTFIANKLTDYATPPTQVEEQQDDELTVLSKQLDDLQALLNEYVDSNYQQARTISNLTQQVAELEIAADNTELLEQKAALQQQLNTANTNVESLTLSLQQYQQLVESIQAQIQALQSQLDSSASDYESATQQIAQLQSLLDAANANITQLTQQIATYQSQIQALEIDVLNSKTSLNIERTAVVTNQDDQQCYIGLKFSQDFLDTLLNLCADAQTITYLGVDYFGNGTGLGGIEDSRSIRNLYANDIILLPLYRQTLSGYLTTDYVADGDCTTISIHRLRLVFGDESYTNLVGSGTAYGINITIDLDPSVCQIITL